MPMPMPSVTPGKINDKSGEIFAKTKKLNREKNTEASKINKTNHKRKKMKKNKCKTKNGG